MNWVEFVNGQPPHRLANGLYEARAATGRNVPIPDTVRVRLTDWGWYYEADPNQPFRETILAVRPIAEVD